MGPKDFCHLHVHSDFSTIDGAARVHSLAQAAAKASQSALAITDHGSVSGHIEFWKACKSADVKPILGCEAYLAPGLADDAHLKKKAVKKVIGSKRKGFGAYNHFTLLAKNLVGVKNLWKLSSIAAVHGFYYRPRMSWALIKEYREGLIALSGCLSGPLSAAVLQEKQHEALAHAKCWRDLFGDDFYIEMMPDLPDTEDQATANAACLEIARRIGSKLVATADVHYINKADADIQEIKICVNNHRTLEENRAKGLHMAPSFYFKESAEMVKAFSHCPEAILSTREIAEKIEDFELLPGKYFLPKFDPPDGSDSLEYYRALCWQGLSDRYGVDAFTHAPRLVYEMECIEKLGFIDYFLIVHDFIRWARDQGIPVGPGRGSAAGSVVSYCLRITNIDPIRYGLIFERFMNPERVSMPDIDIDFCERSRDRVIQYVRDKYGENAVAQIATFGTSKAKGAMRDVGRVLGLPPKEVDKLGKMIPEGPGVKLRDCLEEIQPLKDLADTKQGKRLIDLALGLEGLKRNMGRHAAGIVIGDIDLIERIPLTLIGKKGEKVVCTAFTMEEVEDVGLIKMDFLGLRTITQIDDTVKLIAKTIGKVIDPDDIPVRDMQSMESTAGDHLCQIHEVSFAQCRCCDKTLELLCRAESNGVFQVESSGMKRLLKDMQPDRFDDFIALVALYRPGPLGSGMDKSYVLRKRGEEEIELEHPDLAPIVKDTYGIFCYQEQLMQLSVVLAGFTLPEADMLRKATAKKKPKLMAKIGPQFIDGCQKVAGLSREAAEALWDKIVFFSAYSFNKCATGDTQVMHAVTGEVTTVEELFENRRPFKVHALDDNWKIKPRRVTDVVFNGRRHVYELITSQGRRIKTTATHRFRTFNGWEQLRRLKPGDLIATPRVLSAKGDVKWKKYEIVVLAGLISEGCLLYPTMLTFSSKGGEFLEDFVSAAREFPKTNISIHEDDGGKFTVRMNSGGRKECGFRRVGRSVTARCGAFAWADELGILGHGAKEKSIPDDVFKFNDDDIALFIGRLWSGDGYVAGKGSRIPFYATSSPVLAVHVSSLLLRLSIVGGVHKKLFKYKYKGVLSERIGYTVNLVGEESLKMFVDKVTPNLVGRDHQIQFLLDYREDRDPTRIRGTVDVVPKNVRGLVRANKLSLGVTWDEFSVRTGVCPRDFYGTWSNPKKTGFRRDTIEKIAVSVESDELLDIAKSDVFWDKIVSIEHIGKRKTYDLTVEHDHNFVANNIIVHNSHSASYALIGWHTAWLKANYPIQFFAALMSAWSGETDDLSRYISEARSAGITVEQPDVNVSQVRFSIRKGDAGQLVITYGLVAIKGIGLATAQEIVSVREQIGRFNSVLHFCEEVNHDYLDTGHMDALASAGAFDSTGATRSKLLTKVSRIISKKKSSKEVFEKATETAMRLAKETKKDRSGGQELLFGNQQASSSVEAEFMKSFLPDVPEWKPRDILVKEKEALGLYLSGHPLDDYAEEILKYATILSSQIGEVRDISHTVVMGGIVKEVRRHQDSRGRDMAFVVLEDLSGPVHAVMFAGVWDDYGHELRVGRVLFLRGVIDREREPPSMRVSGVIPPSRASKELEGVMGVQITLRRDFASDATLTEIGGLLVAHPGSCPVFWRWQERNGENGLLKRMSITVSGTPMFRKELVALVGESGWVQKIRY